MSRSKTLSFYKAEANKALPLRTGPVQCVRNCSNCVINPNVVLEELEEIIAIKSYDDLVTRKSLKYQGYQTIQYHVGQLDILKASIRLSSQVAIVYLIGATNQNDLRYLDMVLEHSKMTKLQPCRSQLQSTAQYYLITYLKSCPTKDDQHKYNDTTGTLKTMLKKAFTGEPIIIVPVMITKDHDWTGIKSLGSVCVQLLEPYNTEYYLNKIDLKNDPSTHLIQHLYHDMAMNVGILPSHIVAFLLLYLNRDGWVGKKDLCDYMDWFKKTSSDTGLKLCFTGSSDNAVTLGLLVLQDFIYHRTDSYMVRDIDSVLDYAMLIYPIMGLQAVISKAILVEHNDQQMNEGHNMTMFHSNTRVKVLKDKVIETANKLGMILEKRLPIRPPCTDVPSHILVVMERMRVFDRYFKISEPTMRRRGHQSAWAGDSDDDDNYWIRNQNNPAYMSWLVLTERSNRLDRLNLLVNFINTCLP